MKEDFENVKIWCGRSDLIGDTVMALPMLHYFEKKYPNSYKYWSILRKCSQGAPLYFNHPLIDKIVISDYDEGFGETDAFYFNQCDVRINTRPEHEYIDWYNKYSMGKETWLMAGLPEKEYDDLSEEEKTPKLYNWFCNPIRQGNVIGIHCFAGYGRDNHRSPDSDWWQQMIYCLQLDGYIIYRFGHPREPNFLIDDAGRTYFDVRHHSFMDQIKEANISSLYIGTDSGFSLAMGAYSHPQITLLTNWNVGHKTNFNALEPINKNNITLFNPINKGGCSGISYEKVLESIKNIL